MGWADVATRHDVDHLATVLHSEMAVLRSDLSRQIAEATNRMLRWTVGITIPGFVALAAAVIATG